MGGIGSAVGDLFGGAENNAGFTAKAAPIANPVTKAQLDTGYNTAQTALTGQQDLATALAAQNGMQNQSNVFGQQQNLANALQMQAQGQGPNPAQAQLAQNTAANTANQAALMAGQRGAGANAGLIARQAAMQGGANQQAAVGQQATLQAQQQLAAQQQLGQQQASMQGVAGNQVANQLAGQNAFTQSALGEQQNLYGAQGSFNNAQVGATGSQNSANSGMAQTNANNTGKVVGGLFSGAGSAFGMAKGGVVENPKLAAVANQNRFPNQAMSSEHQMIANIYHPEHFAHGGKVQAMVSPGEIYVPPSKVEKVASGQESPQEAGKKFQGKAEVKGDSLKNDKIPTKLEEGGIVIPRSILDSKSPEKAATKFLLDALKKHGGEKEQADFKSVLSKAAKGNK